MSDSELIRRFYRSVDEDGRLKTPVGQLEFTRSCQITNRFVPPHAVVLDVGSAMGPYSFWMAPQQHAVHLIDLVPEHVEDPLWMAKDSPELWPPAEGSVA